jgi:hypothetical protein
MNLLHHTHANKTKQGAKNSPIGARKKQKQTRKVKAHIKAQF